jgi:hypothetical protein
MYKGGFAGKALFTYRYSYTPRKWSRLLTRAGFDDVEVQVLGAAEPDRIGTLIVRAVARFLTRLEKSCGPLSIRTRPVRRHDVRRLATR